MEGQVEEDASDGKKEKTISPKVARPKLPKFGSHTLGHHYRHKTDPGNAEEIKHLMDEINEMKKWKDTSSIFDKSSIRPKVIKPQTIPKARSTHTSPRASPPPGSHSPNVGVRSSSLNRNRSRSLKLLTDKLKSKVTGGGAQLSPGTHAGGHFKSKSADAAVDSPMFLDPYMNTGAERIPNVEYIPEAGDSDPGQVEPIPEKDEGEDDDKENLSSSSGNVSLPDSKSDGQSQDQAASPEVTSFSDSDTPVTHVSTFTLHPIDRNSEFLRLRQTAPPKRRPGYAGISLPKPKIQVLHRSHGDDGRDSSDESVKKPNKLELPGSFRKFPGGKMHSGSMSRSYGEDGSDSDSSRMFKSPSTESPPPFPGDYEGIASSGSGSPCDMKAFEPVDEATGPLPDYIKEEAIMPGDEPEVETEKQERRNGKSPKQKSKSDPSGNRSFDFDTSNVINSSQSLSSPVLLRDTKEDDQAEAEEPTAEKDNDPEADAYSEGPVALDSLNNNETSMDLSVESIEEKPEQEYEESEKAKESVSEDIHLLFAPEGDIPEPFEDALTNSQEGEEFHDALNVPVSEITEDNFSIGSSAQSIASQNSAPATPMSYSPTGTTDKQHHLSVPVPKRPILRSVSSASVFQRERKYSANSKDKDTRKHSLTTGDEAAPSESKTTDYLPVGDLGNVSASSMPSLNTERQASVSSL